MTYIFRDSLGIQVVSMLNRNMKLLYLKILEWLLQHCYSFPRLTGMGIRSQKQFSLTIVI